MSDGKPGPVSLYGSAGAGGGNAVRTAVAELIGTFLLVLVGTSVATTSVLSSNTYSAGSSVWRSASP